MIVRSQTKIGKIVLVEKMKYVKITTRYFISYRNNRRICSANGRLPPMVKRQ